MASSSFNLRLRTLTAVNAYIVLKELRFHHKHWCFVSIILTTDDRRGSHSVIRNHFIYSPNDFGRPAFISVTFMQSSCLLNSKYIVIPIKVICKAIKYTIINMHPALKLVHHREMWDAVNGSTIHFFTHQMSTGVPRVIYVFSNKIDCICSLL